MKIRYLIIFTFLAMVFIMVKPQNAISQTYICGAGPGPGEVMVGMTQGGNGIAPVPICAKDNSQSSNPSMAPKSHGADIDNYISCASHTSSIDTWCGLNFRSKEDAKKSVLDACEKDMGSGCVTFGSAANITIIVGRNKNYQLCIGSGETRKYAKKDFEDYCKVKGGFKEIHEYNATSWHEAKFGAVSPVYYTPSGFYHLVFGAVAKVKGNLSDDKFKNKFFISTGLKSPNSAQEMAIKSCKDETKQDCEIALNAVPNGRIHFQVNSEQQVSIAWGEDFDEADLNSKQECEKSNKPCTSRGGYDVNEIIQNSSDKIIF